jgi:hypothetical protein
MSKITNIFDYLHNLVETTLDSSYRELTNAFDIEDNDELNLVKGWALVPGPGDNTHRIVGCKMSQNQQWGIALTRLITATDHDITAKNTLIKEILEDHYLIAKAFENNKDLGGNTSRSVQVAHSGIEYLEGDRDKYYLMVIAVSTEYFEDLT